VSEARKALRAGVRGAWDTHPALIAIQDALTKKGFELARPAFRECLESGTESVSECYAKIGKSLSEAYRSIWGAK